MHTKSDATLHILTEVSNKFTNGMFFADNMKKTE